MFTYLTVSRQCPLVLLIKVTWKQSKVSLSEEGSVMGGLLAACSRRKCLYCYFHYLPPIADLPENTQGYCDTDSLLLPVCTVAKPVKAMNKYSGKVLGCDQNTIPNCF